MSKYLGVHFLRDDESGIALMSVENITRSELILVDEYVDLYTADKDATIGEYEDFIYWFKTPYPDEDYNIIIANSGKHNINSMTPWNIQIAEFLTEESLTPPEIQPTIVAWHTDHISDVINIVVEEHDDVVDFDQTITFSGNNVTTEFAIDGSNRASDFIKISINGFDYLPTSTDLTWGSDVTWEDETIDSDGYFTISFIIPPVFGVDNVILYFKPKINKCRINHNLIQPTDGINYHDLKAQISLLDYIVEIIP